MPGDETRIVKGISDVTSTPRAIELDYRNRVKVDIGSSSDSPGVVGVADDVVNLSFTPTISTGAYAPGDALGGRCETTMAVLDVGNAGIIEKVVIIDDDDELAPIDIVFFDGIFTPTADNSPFDPSDADLQNCIGYVDVAATDYASFNDNCVAAKTSGLRMPFEFVLSGDMVLAFQMVIREAHTFTATDDITVVLTIRRLY